MTGAMLGMSREAISWALRDAPDVPPQCVSVLIGLADAADPRGRGAYLGQATLADYARKSDRQVRSDLTRLADIGLIRRGDQALAGHIAADARPVVYDLAMERKSASARKYSSARKSATGRQSASGGSEGTSDQQEHKGSGSQLPPGSTVPPGSTASRERKPASDELSTNQEISPTERSTSPAESGALFDAPPVATTKRPGRPPKTTGNPAFDEWYAAYPLHKDRGDAEKAWPAALAATGDPQVLVAAAKRYHDDPQVMRGFAKHPGRWLRAKCWLDEPAAAPSLADSNGRHQTFRNPDDQDVYDEELRVQ